MIYQIIRWWATIFLRLYFRKTIVYGLEHVPRKGPLIVASNHPSAFLEASILGTVLGRPLHYLVRGDMFHPKFRWLFNWTNQIPIYRQKDGMSNLRKNASSFDLTYQKLADGEAVLIFPEAKTTLEKKMRPIQRGTAHLAFGTLPFLKDGDELPILTVGVNFTDPRLPGTDVVVRFGAPFLTTFSTRDNRESIDRFTETLSEALSPLIIQIDEDQYEKHYDVLASVYFRFFYSSRPKGAGHDDLTGISTWVNQHAAHKDEGEKVHHHIKILKTRKLTEAIYFPNLLGLYRIHLLILIIFKLIWLLAGGWIWRSARHLVFSKIKANTFKGPVSLGAAMVLFPLISLILSILCLIVGWPLWYVLLWLLTMVSGVLCRPPLGLMWSVLKLSNKLKSSLKKNVKELKSEVAAILS